MKELNEKLQALIDKYDLDFSQKGLKIKLAKRYFETEVRERSGVTGAGAIFNSIDRARDHRTEKKNGYNYERNKYQVIVISAIPVHRNILRREECRDYAFVLRKVERAHIGQEPRRITYQEDKILSRIEKRILKILKKAENTYPKKLCKNNIFDAFRYAMHPKYEYKERFLGKERFLWEMIFLAVFCIFVFGSMFLVWLFTK